MTKKIKQINIFLGDEKTRSDVAEALRVIANDIDRGCYSGIAGWSDVSWNMDLGDEDEDIDNEEENE